MIDVVIDRVESVLDAASELAALFSDQPSSRRTGDLTAFRRLLESDDRAAVSARRFPSDRRRTLAGRLALRALLLDRLGRTWRDLPDLRVRRACTSCGESHGQPRYPSVSMSSATSGVWVMAAVATERATVGADIEVVRPSTWTGFDAAVLHPAEREHFAAHGLGAHSRLQRWADKEAALKASGIGLLADPTAVRIAERSGRRTVLHMSSVSSLPDSSLGWRPLLEAPEQVSDGLAVAAMNDVAGGGAFVASLAAARPESVRLRSFAALNL